MNKIFRAVSPVVGCWLFLAAVSTAPMGSSKRGNSSGLGSHSVSQVDLQMGCEPINNVGLAGKQAPGAMMGTTLQKVIDDQFRALWDGDRLFSMNEDFGTLTAAMSSHTTNLQSNVVAGADFPVERVKTHAPQPIWANLRGRQSRLMLNESE